METKLLLSYLDSKNIDYTIDEAPYPEKVSRIQKAIERKKTKTNESSTAIFRIYS